MVASATPHGSGPGRRLEKERRWLPRLAPHPAACRPGPAGGGTPAEGYPFAWSVYTWLKGENATIERIADPSQLATDLAQFVAAYSGSIPQAARHPGSTTSSAACRSRRATRRPAPRSRPSPETIDVEAVTAAWEAALQAPAWERPPVWIHGDLDSRNLLAEKGRLSAVIDWGGLGVGDPACDVMVAWKILSADTRDIFRSALSVDDATWARSRGWALSQALNALSYYTPETNAVLVSESQRWLAEVLDDLSSDHGRP